MRRCNTEIHTKTKPTAERRKKEKQLNESTDRKKIPKYYETRQMT